ncbi:MAG: membrane bound O-acyl transferase (MBOAT) family protein [Comamonadaceae bacterium]|nr:MAG: membrane bound O-acyl transferase (MBOAT) family protein [Comamonadaceae bacterium]
MLFNSSVFIFIFMPVVLAGYFLIARKSHQGALVWLAMASIFFYAYWSIAALPVLVISICINYGFGTLLAKQELKYRQAILIFSIAVNLVALGYYKYINFFIDNINDVRDLMELDPLDSISIILPIGISFFTFTQIAFLVDNYHGKVKERNFIQYALFVSFFPHLLAGPLLYHRQMMPQFSMSENFVIQKEKIVTGLMVFTVGLAKKLLIADSLNSYVFTFYNSLAQGFEPNFLASWTACLGYTFQLYFDFSGYSDMAVGIALLFGIWLPFNFNSPLRATSIIDFWQRWHITLTKYVGDYLYTPITLQFMRLGQNMPSAFGFIFSLVIPTVFIFLILGFWHGANWTYVFFGGMHGLFIVANHLWRKFFPVLNQQNRQNQSYKALKLVSAWILTFLAVNAASVMFRSDSVATAVVVYKGMLGFYGFSLGNMPDIQAWIFNLKIILLTITSAFLIVFLMPNTISIASWSEKIFTGKGELTYAAIIVLVVIMYVLLQLNFYESPFLYFQF